MSKNILVIGGHGFIGHHLTRQLTELGHDVTVLDPLTSFSPLLKTSGVLLRERLNHAGEHTFFRERLEDFTPPRRYDAIFHLGDYSSQRQIANKTELGIRTFIRNANRLANDPLFDTDTLVYFSSSMIYGDMHGLLQVEESSLVPKSAYAMAKLSAEEILLSTQKIKPSFKRTIIVRPSAVFGPRDTDDRVVGNFISRAIEGFPMIVEGANLKLDFTHVDDLVDGVIKLFNNPAVEGVFNVTRSNRNGPTLNQLANAIALEVKQQTSRVPTIEVRDRDMSYPERSYLSNAAIKAVTDFEPSIDILEALPELIKWQLSLFTTYEKSIKG